MSGSAPQQRLMTTWEHDGYLYLVYAQCLAAPARSPSLSPDRGLPPDNFAMARRTPLQIRDVSRSPAPRSSTARRSAAPIADPRGAPPVMYRNDEVAPCFGCRENAWVKLKNGMRWCQPCWRAMTVQEQEAQWAHYNVVEAAAAGIQQQQLQPQQRPPRQQPPQQQPPHHHYQDHRPRLEPLSWLDQRPALRPAPRSPLHPEELRRRS